MKKYINKTDENSLRRVNAILEIASKDFGDKLPYHVKEDVEEVQLQSERGEGNPHKEMMKKYDKWRTK